MARVVTLPGARDASADVDDDDSLDGETIALDGDRLVIRELIVSGAPAAAVQHCVEQGGDAEETVRRMLEIGGAVLQHGANSTLVQAVIAEMRSEGVTQESLRSMADRVAAKGLAYEDQVRPVLEAAFAPHGDEVEDVSGTPGLDGRSKKGDFLIVLNAESVGGRDRRVVIEAKDRPATRLRGRDGALSYLAAAMENRQAAAGVFVCATDVPALARGRLRVYSGNRVLVRYDKDDGDGLALEVACQLARSLAARALGDEDGLSSRLLVERVERLREVIEQAHDIRRGVLEARRGINRVGDAYDTLRREALAVIHELEDRLAD
jgi:hypothetical protein